MDNVARVEATSHSGGSLLTERGGHAVVPELSVFKKAKRGFEEGHGLPQTNRASWKT